MGYPRNVQVSGMNTDDDDDDELIRKLLQRNVLQNHVMSITYLQHPPAQSSAINNYALHEYHIYEIWHYVFIKNY
jgi:hypothetical protein